MYTLTHPLTQFGDILGLGTPELLLILVILLLLFGSSKLPGLARSIGKSAAELKKGFNEQASDEADQEDSKKQSSKTKNRSAK